jgi:cell wall-associated NlpC family hydrolase
MENGMKATRIVFAALSMVGIASATDKIVLGRMGQATAALDIYAAPNIQSRVFYHCRPFEYLVVRDAKESKWTQVLLRTGVYGYVSKSSVVILPYEVTANGQTQSTRETRTARQLVTSRSGSALADYSLNFIGTPYKWGGTDVRRGIDCSGFVKQMYGAIGVRLPRTASEQAMVGQPIARLEYLQPGDRLYFWEAKRAKIGHTGIYLGNGYFVHSSHGHGGIATDYLTENWRRILVAARR